VSGLSVVHRFVVEHYGLEELRTLCFDLGANYDDLPGETLGGKARELILWAGRERQIEKLLAALREGRLAAFDQSGLSLAPNAVANLYADLAAFAENTAPPTAWTRFRSRPLVFYPTLGIGAAVIVIAMIAGMIGAIGGLSGAQQELRTAGLIPTLTPTFTPTLSPTPTATPIPLAFTPADRGEALVVVATFHEAQGLVGMEAQKEVRRGIQAAAAEAGFNGLRVEVEPTILEAEDRPGAEKLGRRYSASMVIWGGITGGRVTVNYLNLKQPHLDAASATIQETKRTQLVSPSDYSRFIIHDLPGEMAFLSLYSVAQSYFNQGRYPDSARAIEAALSSVNPANTVEGLADAYFLAGWLYDETGERDHVIAAYDSAIALRPDYAEAYNNRGMARKAHGDLAGALSDYDQAIRLKQDFVLAYYNRGNARRQSGDLTGAVADYSQALEVTPDDPDTVNNLCWTYILLAQADRGLEYCEQAVKLAAPDDVPGSRDSRALAYALLGRYSEALADFEAFVVWAEQYPEDYADVLARRREWIEVLKRGVNPITPEVLKDLQAEQAY
jgi:tetratricopeptide (TPR) repeat protein